METRPHPVRSPDSRLGSVVLAGVLVLVLTLAVIGSLEDGSDSGAGTVPLTSASQGAVAGRAATPALAADPRVVARTRVGAQPVDVAVGAGAVWVANQGDGTVSRVDPVTNAVTVTILVGDGPRALAVDDRSGDVWVVAYGDDRVVKLHPDRAGAETAGGCRGPHDLVLAVGSAWIACLEDDIVLRLDAATLAVRARIPVGHQPRAIAWDGGVLWVASLGAGRLQAIDVVHDRVARTIEVPGADEVVASEGGVWVLSGGDGALSAVDPDSGSVRPVRGSGFGSMALDGQVIWVAGLGSGVIERLDRRGGEPLATIAIGQGSLVSAIAVGTGALGRDSIWVTDIARGELVRIIPTRPGP